MKCKYCHADIERGAQFCTSCGKDLSVFDKCVNCGELLEKDTRHCPYCGTEQPHKEVAEPKGSKKWIWAVACILLLCVIGGGFYFLKGNIFGWSQAGETDSSVAVENDAAEAPDISKGFLVKSHYGYYFYVPKFLTEGEQEFELAKDNQVYYKNNGYSLLISVEESDIESQFWMYDTMRSRAGAEPYEESMKTIENDYMKVDDKSESVLLIIQSKGDKMCGTMYFTYPNGGKAIVDEAIEKSIQKTRENDV